MTAGWHRRGLGAAAIAVAVGVLVLWWAWPSLAGHDERLGVLVVGDSFLEPGRRSIELQAREIGSSVRWEQFDASWCTDPAGFARLVEDTDPERVVIAATSVEGCDGVADTLERPNVVAVVEPGAAADLAGLRAAGYAVVDPARLVGGPGSERRLECEWWETCDGDGRIAVRDDSGELTAAGHERVARMIVAAL